jgi:hypothetical protein
LLDYAANVASPDPTAQVRVAALPSGGRVPHLADAVAAVFSPRGVRDVTLGLLTEPEVGALFDAATAHESDLLIVRHPRLAQDGRSLARRLLLETPCAVCFVPTGSAPRIERIVAGVPIEPEGAGVLSRAARLCSAIGARELVAVHALASHAPTLQLPDVQIEALLALYRHKANVPLRATHFTPVVVADRSYPDALLDTANRRSGDVVMVGRPRNLEPRGVRPLDAEHLLWACPIPLLSVPPDDSPPTLGQRLKRFLARPEPQFN